MTTRNTAADKFALLFSADWFRPYWALTGFVPRPDAAQPFQQKMRELVDGMMGDETTYWYVNFTEDRLGETRNGLLEALDRYHAPESNLALIEAMVRGQDVAEALTDVSMTFWSDYEATFQEIRRADLTATEWDRHLVSLTADLPSLLQDFALVTVLAGGI